LGGVHEKEIVRFVKRHVRELETVSTAFLSVSLSEAGAENLDASAEDREVAAADAKRMINAFLANTEWRPNFAVPIAGALPYTKYNRFIRWLMKRMARSCGAPTDSSRDWVLTDWHVLDDLAERMAACGRCSSEALTGHPD
jgi:menaquinone-dependent protoporphyrinogen oxidase